MRLTYKPGWDLATIPDDLLYRESGRRMAVGRRVSRPKKLSPCPHCGEPKGVGEMRTHAPICKRIHNGLGADIAHPRQTCSLCKTRKLSPRNSSGVCRECQRRPGRIPGGIPGRVDGRSRARTSAQLAASRKNATIARGYSPRGHRGISTTVGSWSSGARDEISTPSRMRP